MDVVFGALAQALAERAIGAPFSTLPIFALSGVHPETRRYFVTILFSGGGYGGSRDSDGLVNGALPLGIARAPSVEVMEQWFPIRYRRFAIREDSGGAGRRAGGCAALCEVEFLGVDGLASNLGDRMKFAPFGVLGGRSGQPARIALIQDGVTRPITKETGITLVRGDRILMEYPGGGGYGDPATREVELIVRDVRRGYISRETARAAYGVVLENGSLDVDPIATAKARAAG
jgi:N-methylhydantoinase B